MINYLCNNMLKTDHNMKSNISDNMAHPKIAEKESIVETIEQLDLENNLKISGLTQTFEP